ncbi:MAG TPA: radical SAM protein [Opitutales bacterium]|nr:radical SAM protein [Opitutales bacterium]
MKFKFILPSLIEAESPFWRPIKYSLFPPLGLATLAGFLSDEDEAEIVDQHVQALDMTDWPDVVAIQVYITNAYRAYAIADAYRRRGIYVVLGGLHVTSLPEEAAWHADTIIVGPAEEAFPRFLSDLREGRAQKCYSSEKRTLVGLPKLRRDLIDRKSYLVPNSIVVTRGCPHHCDFCYKDAFYQGGKSFYTQQVDDALAEIERLPGRHLYFLDDHLLGHKRFASDLFREMRGMARIFQGAATVTSVLDGHLIEEAAEAGLRSLFVGFESLSSENLKQSNKGHNLGRDYEAAIHRLHDLGIMINGSFVYGLDDDDVGVFDRTVNWAIDRGITTSTFHIATPYPGTAFYNEMKSAGRMLTDDWDLFDTRHVTYRPERLSAQELKAGYDRSYREFYKWSSIVRSSLFHGSAKHQLKHFFYTSGWKKFEPLWNFVIQMKRLKLMTPLLESVLSEVTKQKDDAVFKPAAKKRVPAGGPSNTFLQPK